MKIKKVQFSLSGTFLFAKKSKKIRVWRAKNQIHCARQKGGRRDEEKSDNFFNVVCGGEISI